MFVPANSKSIAMRLSLLATLAILVLALPVTAQDGYKKAPPEVSSILSAPVTPTAFVSPSRDVMLLATSLRYPPLADLAEPMLRLAGQRINPNTNGPHRYAYFVYLSLKRLPAERRSRSHCRLERRLERQCGAPMASVSHLQIQRRLESSCGSVRSTVGSGKSKTSESTP